MPLLTELDGIGCAVSINMSCLRHLARWLYYRRRFFFLRRERDLGCDRVVALQPNQEVKHPHPPANRETVADISAKHCVYRRRKPEYAACAARRKKNLDELLRVPRIDEPKINVHRAVHRSLISREQAFCLARVIEHFDQRVGAFFATEHGKKNAAAENRVDESSGVAYKQPAIAVQTLASIGEIRFVIGLRNAPRFCHSLRNGWLFRQRLLEKIFRAELGFTESFTVENHSDARSLIGEWNQPKPPINSTNQNRQRAINSFRTPYTIVMSKDR